MATQRERPKRNNSPINSKLQPLKATAPLSSVVRNISPTRRRTSPSSEVLPPDVRNRFRRSPDISYNDPRSLVSPLGPKGEKTSNGKKSKNIRRTSSLEALSQVQETYLNGQWQALPTPTSSVITYNSPNFTNRYTQTPSKWDDSITDDSIHSSIGHRRSASFGNADSKEKFRQCLQRTKQSQPMHDKQSPVQGNHSAIPNQYISTSSNYKSSKPVEIPHRVPSSPKNPSLHTRRSVEGLNIELEGLDLESREEVFARTPPEGRRPPVPGIQTQTSCSTKNTDMQTQAGSGWVDTSLPHNEEKRSQSTSPSWAIPAEQKTPTKESPSQTRRSLSADSSVQVRDSPETSNLVPKYASSPKPNNSFLFAREPPDGAEKIPLSIEDIENGVKNGPYSCPDTSKVAIKFSSDSAFSSLPSQPKVIPCNMAPCNMAPCNL